MSEAEARQRAGRKATRENVGVTPRRLIRQGVSSRRHLAFASEAQATWPHPPACEHPGRSYMQKETARGYNWPSCSRTIVSGEQHNQRDKPDEDDAPHAQQRLATIPSAAPNYRKVRTAHPPFFRLPQRPGEIHFGPSDGCADARPDVQGIAAFRPD
ncbi:hypothetical protein PMIN01_11838 [Paraphaeosphaeria minitans]|uniref:Uncharacterized protein n=1 Tax=Paraphaeosphaeria minitans TaxID=565426 RepID=A0A9P6G8T2_9PLEO|nr:hypothetical protein PMIN01_11838 [Paraphaeosphaeria minitans]